MIASSSKFCFTIMTRSVSATAVAVRSRRFRPVVRATIEPTCTSEQTVDDANLERMSSMCKKTRNGVTSRSMTVSAMANG